MFKGTRYFGALLLFVSASSFAGLIEFEGISGIGNPVVTSYRESKHNVFGTTFSSSHMHIIGSPTQCLFGGGCVANPASESPWRSSGQYLAQEGGSLSSPITVTDKSPRYEHLGDGLFNLWHLSVAELFLDDGAVNNGGFRNATTITATGTRFETEHNFAHRLNPQTITRTFTLDGFKDGAGGKDDFQIFFAGFTNVASVVFTADGAFALDGFSVTVSPEPATWALFLLGLASLVYYRRRSTHAVKAFSS